MSNLRDLVKDLRQGKVRSSLSCIPGIVDKDPYKYAKHLFDSTMLNQRDTNKISIIDQYFSVQDLYIITDFFGGFRRIKLEVVSKFKSADNDDPKIDRIEILKKQSKNICENGLFSEIQFIQSSEKMHDRYYIFWRDDIVKLVISVGGSVSQRFDYYVFISEITEKYLETCIIQYYELLCGNILKRF
jgi:hypothetical protein